MVVLFAFAFISYNANTHVNVGVNLNFRVADKTDRKPEQILNSNLELLLKTI